MVGIARGRMLEAIRSNSGLSFKSPAGTDHVSFPVVAAPADIAFRPDDVIFLAMKGQDTAGALEALRAAGHTASASHSERKAIKVSATLDQIVEVVAAAGRQGETK